MAGGPDTLNLPRSKQRDGGGGTFSELDSRGPIHPFWFQRGPAGERGEAVREGGGGGGGTAPCRTEEVNPKSYTLASSETGGGVYRLAASG